MPKDITTGAQTVTGTGAVTGTLSTATLTTPPTLIRVDVTDLIGGNLRIEIQDTANSSEFSDAQTVAVFDATGPDAQLEFSITPDMYPDLRYGATYNQLRAYVTEMTASSATVHAYAEPQGATMGAWNFAGTPAAEADGSSSPAGTMLNSPATVAAGKTVTLPAAGQSAAQLTTPLATAPENLTVAGLQALKDAADSYDGGEDPNRHLRTLLL